MLLSFFEASKPSFLGAPEPFNPKAGTEVAREARAQRRAAMPDSRNLLVSCTNTNNNANTNSHTHTNTNTIIPILILYNDTNTTTNTNTNTIPY